VQEKESSSPKDKETVMKKIDDISIINETNEYLAVNKPAGLLIHPKSLKDTERTLVDVLGENRNDLKLERAGIVHRLDRDTTGVVLVAKTNEAFEYLKRLFKSRKIKKTYIALVEGQIDPRIELIDLPLKRSGSNKLKRVVSPVGKTARTLITEVESKADTSLLRLEPQTGRTNQIRVHLAHIGHPVVSDVLYGAKKQADRFMLHAYSLEFEDPAGQRVKLIAPLPDDMRDLCESFGYEVNKLS